MKTFVFDKGTGKPEQVPNDYRPSAGEGGFVVTDHPEQVSDDWNQGAWRVPDRVQSGRCSCGCLDVSVLSPEEKLGDGAWCHCGQAAWQNAAGLTRGMCQECDAMRCDAYPGACRKMRRVETESGTVYLVGTDRVMRFGPRGATPLRLDAEWVPLLSPVVTLEPGYPMVMLLDVRDDGVVTHRVTSAVVSVEKWPS